MMVFLVRYSQHKPLGIILVLGRVPLSGFCHLNPLSCRTDLAISIKN